MSSEIFRSFKHVIIVELVVEDGIFVKDRKNFEIVHIRERKLDIILIRIHALVS